MFKPDIHLIGSNTIIVGISLYGDGVPLEEDMVVSESEVWDYVWAVYLLKLAEIKNYPIKEYELEDSDFGMLEIACERGWNILETLQKKVQIQR